MAVRDFLLRKASHHHQEFAQNRKRDGDLSPLFFAHSSISFATLKTQHTTVPQLHFQSHAFPKTIIDNSTQFPDPILFCARFHQIFLASGTVVVRAEEQGGAKEASLRELSPSLSHLELPNTKNPTRSSAPNRDPTNCECLQTLEKRPRSRSQLKRQHGRREATHPKMSNPRTTRSRVSSPYVAAPASNSSEPKTAVAGIAQRPKTMLDKWVEPSLPTPKPSFADAGMERHGVVQNMAPLGTLPSSKIIKQAARSEGGDALGRTRRSRRSSVSTPTPAESTMTPDPIVNTPTPIAEEEPEEPRRMSVSTDKTDGDEAVAKEATPPVQDRARSRSRGQSARLSISSHGAGQPVFSIKSPVVTGFPARRNSSFTPSPGLMSPASLAADGLPQPNQYQTSRIVESAVEDALEHGRYPTAYALRNFWDDNLNDLEKCRLVEEVIYGLATTEREREFQKLIAKRKHEGSKDWTADYYFNGDGSDPAPSRPILHSLNFINPPAPIYQTPYTPVPRATALELASSSSSRGSASSTAMSAPISNGSSEHISKKHKTNGFRAVDGEIAGGLGGLGRANENGLQARTGNVTSQSPGPTTNGSGGGVSEKRTTQTRGRSVSSSSELSSVPDMSPAEGDEDVMATSDNHHKHAANAPAPAAPPYGSAPSSNTGLGLLARFNPNFDIQQGPKQYSSPYASTSTSAWSNPAAPVSSAETLARNQGRPINAKPRSGPKVFTFKTLTSTTRAPPSSLNNNTTNPKTQPPAAAAVPTPPSGSDMPSATREPSPLPLPLGPFQKEKGKKSGKQTPVPVVAVITEEDRKKNKENTERKRKIRVRNQNELQANIKQSHERGGTSEPPEDEAALDSDAPEVEVPIVVHPKRPRIRLLNKQQDARETRSHRNNDSEASSPTLLSFRSELAPGSRSASRAATPNLSSRPSRKAKGASGLRIKQSPVKKKGAGTLAGIPRASGERNSPNGATQEKEDNDDYCSACSGGGYLVCCDLCWRSFHAQCIDPPLDPDNLPDSFVCNECQVKHHPEEREEYHGLFRRLLSTLEKKNSSAFSLPKDIREHYDHVKTGASGEFEETNVPKVKRHNGWEENPDYFRLKDTKGNFILCYHCSKSPRRPDRSCIQCAFCENYWHLDCLPVPLAKEPSTARPWMCPLHVKDLQENLDFIGGPAHKWRTVKGAPMVVPAHPGRMRNHGFIELEDSDEDEAADEEEEFDELREFGRTYKLPKLGVKLDFITRVKQMGGGLPRPQMLVIDIKSRTKRQPVPTWDQRSVGEQQAALNLASLAVHPPEIQPHEHLINTLLSEAPPNAIALIAQGAVHKPLTDQKAIADEKRRLLTLQALLAEKLKVLENDEAGLAALNAPAKEVNGDITTPTSITGKQTEKSAEDDDVSMQD